MSDGTPQFATYKGRKYKLLFIGETRFGRRAHLQFQDGTKDFWVDERQISTLADANDLDPDPMYTPPPSKQSWPASRRGGAPRDK
jgi:hypothetical protein